MRAHYVTVVVVLSLAALVAADLVRTLKTGRARGRGGIITRKGRPQKYWRYVYASYVMLAVCAGLLLWVLIAPETL